MYIYIYWLPVGWLICYLPTWFWGSDLDPTLQDLFTYFLLGSCWKAGHFPSLKHCFFWWCKRNMDFHGVLFWASIVFIFLFLTRLCSQKRIIQHQKHHHDLNPSRIKTSCIYKRRFNAMISLRGRILPNLVAFSHEPPKKLSSLNPGCLMTGSFIMVSL